MEVVASVLNLSDCQKLCRGNMCCFEEDERYSCMGMEDVIDCGVFAGCVVLVDDNFW